MINTKIKAQSQKVYVVKLFKFTIPVPKFISKINNQEKLKDSININNKLHTRRNSPF